MNDVEMREKVIKGLECCTKKVCIFKNTLKECPYWELCGEYEGAFEDCTSALAKDALSMLKAQAPVTENNMAGLSMWCCGSCGTTLFFKFPKQTDDADRRFHYRFCSYCGRKVKWE